MTLPAASHARDLTDEQWVLIGPFLPKLARRTDGRGRPWRENRAVLNESDRLDADLARCGVELIAPHRKTRTSRTQDGRPLRRYRRRWKVERLFAWFQNFRRLVVRYERYAENFLAMLHLACCLILLRGL
jgi:transposase